MIDMVIKRLKLLSNKPFNVFAPPSNSYEHVVKIDGVSACTTNIKDNGKELTVYGWDSSHYKYVKGDRILIVQDKQKSRYRIEGIGRPWNVSDMYFLYCVFHPRRVPYNDNQ